MGILKLTPGEFQDISYTPKELSDFWKMYFSTLSVNLSKLFYKYTKEPVSVRYLHRDIVKGKDYLDAICDNSVIRPFKINPNTGLGFLFITDDLAAYFINSILGGREEDLVTGHLLTNTDFKLLENIMDDILVLLYNQLKEDNRNINFEVIDPGKVLFLSNSKEAHQLISVQQFLVVTGRNSFVFDIAFTNRLLESFVLI